MRVLLALLLLIAAVHADESTAADEVLKAFRAEQDLKPLAEKDDPDPWMVADELCARGARDAALAFAKAAPRPDTKRLPEYVESQQKKPTDPSRRKLLVEVKALVLAEQPKAVLAKLKGVDIAGSDVTSIRLRHFQAIAHAAAGDERTAHRQRVDVADRAVRSGWLLRAAIAISQSATGFKSRRALGEPEALEAAGKLLEVQQLRGERYRVAGACTLLAEIHVQRGDFDAAEKFIERGDAIFDVLGPSFGSVDHLSMAGHVFSLVGARDRAIAVAKKSLKHAKSLRDPRLLAVSHINLAVALIHVDEFKRAHPYAQKARKYFESLEAPDREATRMLAAVRFGIGQIRLGLHNLEGAVPELKAARATFLRLGLRREAAMAAANLCRTHLSLARTDEALIFAREAYELATDRHGQANGLLARSAVLEAQGKYSAAIASYRQARSLCEQLPDKRLHAFALASAAGVHIAQGSHEEAVQLCRQAIRLHPSPLAFGNMAAALVNLGRYDAARKSLDRATALGSGNDRQNLLVRAEISMRTGDHAGALDALQRARVVSQERKQSLAKILRKTAAVYYHQGRPAKAWDFAARSRAIAVRRRDHMEVASVDRLLGILHREQGRFAEAMRCQQRALRIAEAAGAREDVALGLSEIGLVHLECGRYDEALEVVNRARARSEALGTRLRALRASLAIAIVYHHQGRDQDAEALLLRCLASSTKLGDADGVLTANEQLGILYRSRNEFDRALALHRRVLEKRSRAGSWTAAHSLLNIADVQLARGDLAAALECLTQAQRLADKHGNEKLAAGVAAGFGSFHLAVGEHEQAARSFRRSREKLEALGVIDVTESLHNEAVAQAEKGDLITALKLELRCLELRKKLGRYSGGSHLNVGLFSRGLGKREDARRHLREAIEAARARGDLTVEALAWAGVGSVRRDEGEFEEEVRCLHRALSMEGALEPDARRRLAQRVGQLLYIKLGKPAAALPWFQEAIDAFEAQRAHSVGLPAATQEQLLGRLGKGRPYAHMTIALLQLGRVGDAFECLERGRARGVLDMLARSRVDGLREAARRAEQRRDEGLLREIVELRAALAAADRRVHALTFAVSKPQVRAARLELQRRLMKARSERQGFLARRARIVRDVLPVGAPASTGAVQRTLGRHERLLCFMLGDEASMVFLVPPRGGRIGWHRLEKSRAELERLVKTFHEGVARGALPARGVGAAPARAGQARVGEQLLRALVPAALREQLKGVERLYVVPHGPQHRLPLEALPGWLDDLPPVAYVHSGSVLAWCRERKRHRPEQRFDVLALGDPVYTRGMAAPRATLQRGGPLQRLPGTRHEVDAIARTFERTQVLLGEDATKARLFELAPQARFLHLATHQIVDETEFRGYSRLALTAPRVATPEDDGFLSLFELFEKWRDRLSGCELVVLSACETVKGPLQKDEGPYAMPLGFLYAGAPAVIGSLWRVDDESTAKLFAKFYEELKAGKGKLEAFTAARKWLKKKYPDPYHWAPFVFIGDPR